MTRQAETVSLEKIADLFGVTTVTIRNWRKEGMPMRVVDSRARFGIRECIRWRREKDREKWDAEGPQISIEVNEARLRKVSVEAELLEMQRDVQRGKLVEVDRFERALMLAFGRVREKLIAFAPRVAPHLVAMTSEGQAEMVLDKYVAEIITELRADEVPDDEESIAAGEAA